MRREQCHAPGVVAGAVPQLQHQSLCPCPHTDGHVHFSDGPRTGKVAVHSDIHSSRSCSSWLPWARPANGAGLGGLAAWWGRGDDSGAVPPLTQPAVGHGMVLQKAGQIQCVALMGLHVRTSLQADCRVPTGQGEGLRCAHMGTAGTFPLGPC